ncbi:hypothetical protein G3570_07470 [Balneolaceae bacterium YR4-1]|uniref:DUF5777 domain-containing protein n=1 Tax=Halalkalibaculum roseum TaxID=2709311 RepID=A0A6M1SWL4_9BACT|nr:DUF5777 family beta-barrel protein [Halalkalibaculum roseum]NGP76466.1 hypothetical protein [Halalkalibaculum roseum]
MRINKLLLLLISLLLYQNQAYAQMERERVNPGGAISETFWAPNLIGLETTEQISAKNLNVTIMHSFGIVSNRTLQNFFGLDIGPNVRLGLDYGITDNWSIGIGRMTDRKVVDLRSKLNLFRQTKDNSVPFSMSIKGDLGITTQENNRPIKDDMNYLLSLPIANKVSDALSIQIAPMIAHFNHVSGISQTENTLYALGLGSEFRISRRYALTAEYYPVLGNRNPDTINAFALGLNIETGGHVFQLFFASSSWHTEQYIISYNDENFWAGDFRFGFNVNRIFGL